VRFPNDGRISPENLKDTPLILEDGRALTLGQVAHFQEAATPTLVRRESSQRRIGLDIRTNGDLGGTDGSEAATVKAGGTAPAVTNNMVAPYFWDGQGNNFVTYGASGFAPVAVTVPTLAGATSSQIVYTPGEAVTGAEKRCEPTTWMMSPAVMYFLDASTFAKNFSWVWFDSNGIGGTSSGSVSG